MAMRRGLGFWRDVRGSTLIEYVMIAALISIVVAFALPEIGEKVKAMFESVRF